MAWLFLMVRRYRRLEQQIKAKFPNAAIEFSSHATPGATGAFEVSVNGKLVFSKLNGQGYVDSNDKLEAIFSAIAEAVNA